VSLNSMEQRLREPGFGWISGIREKGFKIFNGHRTRGRSGREGDHQRHEWTPGAAGPRQGLRTGSARE
jgi:hypothetical protein